MTESLPSTAVVRVAQGTFDPTRYAELAELTTRQAEYLAPAIKQLPGFIDWYAAVSPEGSIINVSVWESAEHSDQMSRLKEMVVTARGEMAEAGVTFTPIVNYPLNWNLSR
ncbi:hypothetical protein [Kitasatospora viridis]|uniref:Antibiotic biosynthesis monooxygenase n=1 Tax=Kitasatospora viridis TaxID=281105 RepID=A0A561TUW7_9ACTN|nr:hypothetical protein [Kitasatospora viridis]TWF90899.1 hypothetical protein FHX73_1211 [Kitasatospora viridis]